MKRVVFCVLLVLVIVSAAQGASGSSEIVAASNAARSAALELAEKVGAYTRRHPDAPGAFSAWAAGVEVVGEPLLVHDYPSLRPSHYVVDLEGAGAASFVVLGRDGDDRWHYFGLSGSRSPRARVTREEAVGLTEGRAGPGRGAGEACVVAIEEGLYWFVPGRAAAGIDDMFVSVHDPTDMITGSADAALLGNALSTAPREALPTARSPQADPGRLSPRDPPPPAWDLDVPHYFQTGPTCGPTSLEMIFDYLGPHIPNDDIAHASDNAGANGHPPSNYVRASHFSYASVAVQDTTLHGYRERPLGYAAFDNSWSDPEHFDDRYTDLKTLISSGHPLFFYRWFDIYGHYSVLKGYDDSTDVFIVHDPDASVGPDAHFNQSYFVDTLWNDPIMPWWPYTCDRWGFIVTPWEVTVTTPDEVAEGETFTVETTVTYPGPHPFEGRDQAHTPTVALSIPWGLELAAGEQHKKSLPEPWVAGSGPAVITWQVTAVTGVAPLTVEAVAEGLISGSCPSYSSYQDWIGGQGRDTLSVVMEQPVTTILVDHAGNGHFASIQEALDVATPGDTVLVSPGTYTGPSNRSLDFGGKAILLLAASGRSETVLDCAGAGPGFVFDGGENASTIVEGLTIINGQASGSYGGGIVCSAGSSPTIRDCTVSGCNASFFGGGVFCEAASSPLLERVVIADNSSITGSGLYCRTGAAPVLNNCTLVANSSNQIAASDASPLITNSIIAASPAGYAVVCQGSADPTTTHSCIFGNAQGDSLCGSYHDNVFADPLFCGLPAGVLTLHDDSPCLPPGNEWGELIGALGAGGCGPTTGVEASALAAFSLMPAQPNPSRGTTALGMALPAPGRVEVVVYDVSGRRVRTLADRAFPSGTHELVWDGRDEAGQPVSGGVYFCCARLGSREASRKLVLMR
jgi:hypothetical protein